MLHGKLLKFRHLTVQLDYLKAPLGKQNRKKLHTHILLTPHPHHQVSFIEHYKTAEH